MDYDLYSIQEARDLARKAKQAQQLFAGFTQKQVDSVVKAMSEAAIAAAQWLAQMAVDETRCGVVQDKVTKNLFAARNVYKYIKDMKTIGILREDHGKKLVEAGFPMGVVVGTIPPTDPTSTTIYQTLIALKAGNGIVFVPDPMASKCIIAACRVLHEAAVEAGAPEGIIGCLKNVTVAATEELIKYNDISVILSMRGNSLVKDGYSAGKPTYRVGAGNVPVFIERSADIKKAVRDIIISKSFDNGVISSSESCILVDEPIKDQVADEFARQGAYFLSKEEIAKVSQIVMTPSGGMNLALIGKSPAVIADKCGIRIPAGTKILIAPLEDYGPGFPLSYEKLTTVLAYYVVKDWEQGCILAIELLKLMGVGHTFTIHSQNDEIIRQFIQKPVSRILVNTPSSFGGIGYTTGLAPSFSLGCGVNAGSSTSDNVTPMHLINIKRLAYETVTAEELNENEKHIGRSVYHIAEIVNKVIAEMKSSGAIG